MMSRVGRTMLGSSGGFPEGLWQEEAYELMNPKEGERGQDGVGVPRKQLRSEKSGVRDCASGCLEILDILIV